MKKKKKKKENSMKNTSNKFLNLNTPIDVSIFQHVKLLEC